MKREYFQSFDALRFISFFLVFLLHTPIDENSFMSFFSKSGGIGVSFFFVLSGFLITYILIIEKKNFNKISLKNFFVRRILRIWPLFYLMILFAFATPYLLNYLNLNYSDSGYTPNWTFSLLFLENYKMMIEGSFPNTSPLVVMWSLCIEEHFYIIWGLALYYLPLKKLPFLIILSILIANVTRIVYFIYDIDFLDLFSNIDYFAYGAFCAYILILNKKLSNKINSINKRAIYSITLITVTSVFYLPHINLIWLSLLEPTLFGILFMLIIFFAVNNKITFYKYKLISKLGIYTYGLYLYHTIFVNLMIKIFKNTPSEYKNIMIAFSSLAITILVSILSYVIFEKQFLKLKKYFYQNPAIIND